MDVPLARVIVQRISLPVGGGIIAEGIAVAVSQGPPGTHEDAAGAVLDVVGVVAVGGGSDFGVDQARGIPLIQLGQSGLHRVGRGAPVQLARFIPQEISRGGAKGLIQGVKAVAVVGAVQEVGIGMSAVIDAGDGVVGAQTRFHESLGGFAKIIHGLRNFQAQLVQPVLTDEVDVDAVRIHGDVRDGIEGTVHRAVREGAAIGGLHDLLHLLGGVIVEGIPQAAQLAVTGGLDQVIPVRQDDRVRQGVGSDTGGNLLLEVAGIARGPVYNDLDVVIVEEVTGVLVVFSILTLGQRGVHRVDLGADVHFHHMVEFRESSVIIHAGSGVVSHAGGGLPVSRGTIVLRQRRHRKDAQQQGKRQHQGQDFLHDFSSSPIQLINK